MASKFMASKDEGRPRSGGSHGPGAGGSDGPEAGGSPTRRATIALACGVVSLLTVVAASVSVPLGLVAVWLGLSYRADPEPRAGDGRALAGAMAGAIGAVFAVIVLAFQLFGTSGGA